MAAEQTAEAERIIQQILKVSQEEGAVIPDSPSILEPLLTANEHDFAIRLVQEVNEPTRRTRWLTEICLSLMNSGEYNHAKQLAETIRSVGVHESLAYEANHAISSDTEWRYFWSNRLSSANSSYSL